MTTFWENYNSEESWLPFFLPFVFWSGTCVYCALPSSKPRPVWMKWNLIHNTHHIIGIIFGWVSLYFDDDSIFNERVGILWSVSYFVVDLIYCAYHMDLVWSLHAVLCCILGTFNYQLPLSRQLRLNSRAIQCELSSPFLHLSKETRKPLHFLIFAAAFGMCRIVMIPLGILLPLRRHGVESTDWVFLAAAAFYLLNWFWFFKILRIIWRGLRGKPVDDKEDPEKKAS